MSLTLQNVAGDPACATFPVAPPENATLEPLSSSDEKLLAAFFEGLSERTRRFYSVTNPTRQAYEHCTTIARYDKLRLVLRTAGVIVALVEFSFDLPAGDTARFVSYGLDLRPADDCRWGLCVTDALQGQGVGTALAAPSFEVARRFGRARVLLWGGVHAANASALRYYRSVGFKEVGRFTNDEHVDCVDMLHVF